MTKTTKILIAIIALLILSSPILYQQYKKYKFEKEVDRKWKELNDKMQKEIDEADAIYQKEYQKVLKLKKLYENDHYGGKTPEETLQLFVEALKKKDYKLAAKYYVPEKWDKMEGEMKNWVEEYPDSSEQFIEDYNNNGIDSKINKILNQAVIKVYIDKERKEVPFRIEMQLNQINHIWKISKF